MQRTDSGRGATSSALAHERRQVVLSAIGEVVEWFDFMVYLSLAPVLAEVFFPRGSDVSQLIATLAVFAVAYLLRPVGAVVFGQIGDRVGRKQALVLSASLMSAAKLLEGCLPSYAAVGVWAPILLLVARSLSGFSLGGEFTGVMVMLFESARARRRALTTGIANVMSALGVLLATVIVTVLTAVLSSADMRSFGWRVPFFVGALIGVLALVMRWKLEESPLFERIERERRQVRDPLRSAIRTHRRAVLFTFAMAGFNGLSFYLMISYVPTYLKTFVDVDATQALVIGTTAAAFNVVFISVPAWLSDRVGRRPVLLAGAGAFVVLGVPFFLLLATGDLALMLVAALVAVMPATCFMGPSNTAAAERLPTAFRYTGFATGYNLGAAVFGGFTPLVATWLIHASGSDLAPAYYLVAGAVGILLVAWRMRETAHLPVEELDAR